MIQYLDMLVLGWLLSELYYRIILTRFFKRENLRNYTIPRDYVMTPGRKV